MKNKSKIRLNFKFELNEVVVYTMAGKDTRAVIIERYTDDRLKPYKLKCIGTGEEFYSNECFLSKDPY